MSNFLSVTRESYRSLYTSYRPIYRLIVSRQVSFVTPLLCYVHKISRPLCDVHSRLR